MTTALPFREGLDDRSHSFIMSSYILLAHVWVHAAPNVWHTSLEGYVLIPDLTCPVFEDVSLV